MDGSPLTVYLIAPHMQLPVGIVTKRVAFMAIDMVDVNVIEVDGMMCIYSSVRE